MHIAICDDNQIDRRVICDLLRCYADEASLRLFLTEYEAGKNLIYDVEDGMWFDAIFLDIFMNEQLGIDVARKLRGMGYNGNIIFLTSSADFAVDSYEVYAYSYLLKPTGFDKLKTVMDRMIPATDQSAYQIKQYNTIVRIPVGEILYIESSNTKCILHRAGERKYTVYKQLTAIEGELQDPRFLRCHQSYIVNMDHVRDVNTAFVLSTGEEVPIRQRGLKGVRETYLAYQKEKNDRKKLRSSGNS